jgi:hypothetical protein
MRIKIILSGLSLLVIVALVLVGCNTGEAGATQYAGSLVNPKDYFVLPDASYQLHIYQYMGADAVK